MHRKHKRPCLREEPSPDDVQRHLKAQLAPQQRQQHVLRVPHRRCHGRVRAAAQSQDRLDALDWRVCTMLRLAVNHSAAVACEKETWQRRLSGEGLGVIRLKRGRHITLHVIISVACDTMSKQCGLRSQEHRSLGEAPVVCRSLPRTTQAFLWRPHALTAAIPRACASSMQEPAVRVSAVW